MHRAYSLLEIKSVDEDARILEGIATTPTPDRMGDIVEPKGAQFTLPLPLLFQHDPNKPIGHVMSAKVTADGIDVRVQIAKGVAPYIDEAWALIKAKLVRGLSIGFRAIESARIKDTFSEHFTKWDWLELSAVTIPANAEANIQTIKSLDSQQRAASGARPVVLLSPGASGTSQPSKGKAMPTVREHITALENKRAATVARQAEVSQKSIDEGRSMNEAEGQEHDGLTVELKAIDTDLGRFRDQEALAVAKATPLIPTKVDNADAGTAARSGGGTFIDMKGYNLPPGIEFARYVKCIAMARGNLMQAYEISKAQYPDMGRIQAVLKTAVAAGTTTDSTWAGALVDYQNFAGDFISYLRPATIIGKFGQGNVPSLRRVPFNIQVPRQTSGGTGYWVGEGKPKPLTSFAFDNVTLKWSKIAAISVLSQEVIRFSSPSADALVRDALREAIVEKSDIDFIDPDKAAVTDVSPASITNGYDASATNSAGASAANARTDAQTLTRLMTTNNLSLAGCVWIMSENNALALSQMQTSLGQPEHPGLTPTGGTYVGLPVITSQYVKASGSPTESILILCAPSEIYLADDGQVVVDSSDQTALQMLDNPTNDATSSTVATSMVSMFQTNTVAIRAERFINWKLRRSTGAVFLNNVAYAP